MLFTESFPIFYSLGLIVVASALTFLWRFYLFKRKLLQEIKILPSVIILGVKGSGKTSFLNILTRAQATPHPIYDGLNIATLSLGTNKLQFLEIPYFVDGIAGHLKPIKEINPVGGIYVFDVSKNSPPIEDQIEHFKKIKEFFKDLQFIIIANKIDEADIKKVERIEAEFGKIYKISSIDKKLSPETDTTLLKKEFEDIQKILSSLASRELEELKEVKKV